MTRTSVARLARAILLLVPACSRGDSGGTKAPAPARIEGSVAEAQLATVHLTADAERRLGITTAPIELRAMPRARRYAGEVIVAPGGEIELVAPFPALVAGSSRIGPAVGDEVEAGAAILALEPRVSPDREALSAAERTAVGRARADLELLRAQLDSEIAALKVEHDAARVSAERAAALFDSGAGSRAALDDAQARLALAARRLEATKGRRAALDGVVLEFAEGSEPRPITLTAPWRATVMDLHVAPGQLVAAGAALARLAALDPAWVRVEIPAQDAGELEDGAPAAVSRLGSTGKGAIDAVPVPAAETGEFRDGTVERFFELAGPGPSFVPGERVSVELALAGPAESRVVPASAVIRDAHGGAWVYVKRGERSYARARVEVERTAGDLAVLARGPPPGTEVAREGVAELFGSEFGTGK